MIFLFWFLAQLLVLEKQHTIFMCFIIRYNVEEVSFQGEGTPFLDALASLDLKLSVSESVSH